MGRLRCGLRGLFGRRGNGVESDVREKHDGRALVDAAEPVGRERVQIGGVEVRPAHHHENRQRHQLDRHHDVVGGDALARAAQQQPGDQADDGERRDIDQDGNAEDVRRRAQQPVHLRIGAEQRGAVTGGQAQRQGDAEAAQQRIEIIAPGNRHRHVADGVFQNQVPADDPRHQFAQRGVGVGVGAARLRDHGRQFGVAQPGQHAGGAQQQEGKDQRRTRARAHHFAVRSQLSGRGGPDGAENARSDHGADGQHDQVAGAQAALQTSRVFALRHQRRDGFAAKQLGHLPNSNRRAILIFTAETPRRREAHGLACRGNVYFQPPWTVPCADEKSKLVFPRRLRVSAVNSFCPP